jgi:ubiquinone/menaquinone biosynthesis C-methylase UbiE
MDNGKTHHDPNYILGHSESELQRLISQAQFYMRLTRQLLTDAGIGPGQRVLDLGSGTGDVAFLLSEMVGATGQVVGIDKAPEAVYTARLRAAEKSLQNVSFEESNIHSFTPDAPFDAVFGRLLLMYQPDPVFTVQEVARYVKPGGLVIFQELDFTSTALALPPAPTYERAIGWIKGVLDQAKIPSQMGLLLYSTFTRAGLNTPELLASARVEGGAESPVYDYIAYSVQSLLPTMEKLQVVTAEEAAVETLAARMRAEVVQGGGVVVVPHLVGAWARTQ